MKAKTNYMPPDEFEKLEKYILGHTRVRGFKPYDIVMLFKLCYECGLRINEALRLEVNDFDFDNFEIELGTTKTHENDSCSIPPEFAKSLKLYIDTKQGESLDINKAGSLSVVKDLGERVRHPLPYHSTNGDSRKDSKPYL